MQALPAPEKASMHYFFNPAPGMPKKQSRRSEQLIRPGRRRVFLSYAFPLHTAQSGTKLVFFTSITL